MPYILFSLRCSFLHKILLCLSLILCIICTTAVCNILSSIFTCNESKKFGFAVGAKLRTMVLLTVKSSTSSCYFKRKKSLQNEYCIYCIVKLCDMQT